LVRLKYVLKRLLQMIPVLLMVSVLIFVMIRAIPGDPAQVILGEMAKQEDVDRLREQMGLNRPLITQYFIFIKGIVSLDFGNSLVYKQPVINLIRGRMGVTLMLTLFSTFFAVILAVPLGYMAGMNKDRGPDHAIRVGALLAISMPGFWVGLILMILFGVILRWLPPGGWGTTFLDHVRSLILPAVTQCLMTAALLMRNLRNGVVDINSLDYVDFARSKGISETRVSLRHILRNALISTVTLLMMRMAWMLGGSVIIETVFSLPGMGKLLVDSIFGRDYAVVQVLVFLFSALVILMNLITDILYSFLDPRVSL
jgi:peptide/nickel transport system permease protein